ncbi:hypothetical protein ACFQZZ_04260 [Nocardia sp. GCM10030253]|uniref:HflX-like GTP-binding protein n=1 Tax=Nocardia sp. GCM10030253 TaxID=3273404 RepID=UPI0036316F62
MPERSRAGQGKSGKAPVRPLPSEVIDGTDVIVAGLFSAKRTDYPEVMDEVAAVVAGLGGRVVGCFIQRRGISGSPKRKAPGGKALMDQPYSSRTLMSWGKIREISDACADNRANVVVFHNELTDRQQQVLSQILRCHVYSHSELIVRVRSESRNGE